MSYFSNGLICVLEKERERKGVWNEKLWRATKRKGEKKKKKTQREELWKEKEKKEKRREMECKKEKIKNIFV